MESIERESHHRVRTLLERGLADQKALIAHLSSEERAALGEPQSWRAKDHVAHNNFWRQDALIRLQSAIDGSTPPEIDETTQNDRVFLEQRITPWEVLVDETQRLCHETLALLSHFRDEDLSQRDRYAWQQGDSLELLIFTNWYDHPAEHWAEIYVRCQQIDYAFTLREEVATTVRELFPLAPKLYSYMVYKLGSLAAQNGRVEQSLQTLQEALTLNPSLSEWIQQDTALESLRALPEFQGLMKA